LFGGEIFAVKLLDKLYQQSLKWKFNGKNLTNSNKKYTNVFLSQKQHFHQLKSGKSLVDKIALFTGLYVVLVHTNKIVTPY